MKAPVTQQKNHPSAGPASRILTSYALPVAIIIGFAVYFTKDIITSKEVLLHPDFYTYYYSFRHWFSLRLAHGVFPLWNPYWGIGHPAEAWATIPLDLYTPLELAFGPRYGLFQGLQALGILGAGFYALCRLGFSPILSAAGAILFFLSPWVSYFFFYFIHGHSFIAHTLLFSFVYLWFQSGERRYLFFITWTTIFSMLGTKVEFWFFQTVHFSLLVIVGAVIFSNGRLRTAAEAAGMALGFMAIGIAAHAWQLSLFLPTIGVSGRTEHSLANLFSGELYRNLFGSFTESVLIKMAVVTLLLYLALITRLRRAGPLTILAGASATFFVLQDRTGSLFLTRDGTFAGVFRDFFSGPVLVGALLGLFLTTLVLRDLSWRDHAKTTLLFLIFVYYYCRQGIGDLAEIQILQSAPAAFKFALAAFVWLGCRQIRTSRLAQLAYISILLILILRDQGQIVLAYLAGLQWIPTRDNYIIDWAFLVLAMVGLGTVACEAPAAGGLGWPRSHLLAEGLALSAVFVTLVSTHANLYYVHALIGKAPADYPYFEGVPNLRALFRSLREDPTTRVFWANDNFMEFHHGMGSSLLEGLSQATLYASLGSGRYRDWTIFHQLGIRPEQHWQGYSNETTPGTIARLPKTNTLGYTNSRIYAYTLINRPPLDKNLLELLGVTYVLRLYPVVGPYKVEDREPPQLDEEVKRLRPNRIRLISGRAVPPQAKPMYVAEMSSPLPRAFLVHEVSEDRQAELRSEMAPRVEKGAIRTRSFLFPVTRAKITRYEPERVKVESDAPQGTVLVLSDLFHPFWQARIDGRPAEIFPAFSIFRGVKVPAGRHEVDFICRVPYLPLATTVSVLVTLGSVLAFLWLRRREA